MSAAGVVRAGSYWQNRNTLADVLVMRVTSTGNVVARRRDGKIWNIPLGAFLSVWEQTNETEHTCAKCGTSTLRVTDKYCKDCQSLIARVRNAKKHSEVEPVLTTTNPKLIEQKHQDAQPEPSQAPANVSHDEPHGKRWRVRGHIEMEVTVLGETMIDALDAADKLYQGMEVTDCNRLD